MGEVLRDRSSDYERIGGGPAVTAVVDRFHELILTDQTLVEFFDRTDMARLRRHQAQLITQVLGGPAAYDGPDLRAAHAGLGIARGDHLKVVAHLVQAMVELRVAPALLERIRVALAATEPDVVSVGASCTPGR
ncbi:MULTISPECIES: group I truncated hemoglobin [unclassified Nocardioides]|uniref:group I truncated hemoglobin n=1 Tax=unclassified Nocardioides TaxID=2615069 RepID=UPI0036146ADD